MTEQKLTITVPEMTIERYAQHVGVSNRTVEGWVNRGLLPTIKIGKRRLINVAARAVECLEKTTAQNT